jgi:uncharacterized protein with PIN domain
MKLKPPDQIMCESCILIIGTVTEIQTSDRVGFFSNKPDPDPMPAQCPECQGPLTRVITK